MRTLGYPTWAEVRQGVLERAVSAAERVTNSLSVRDALDNVVNLAERAVAHELFESARIDDRVDFDSMQRDVLHLVYATEYTKTLLLATNERRVSRNGAIPEP